MNTPDPVVIPIPGDGLIVVTHEGATYVALRHVSVFLGVSADAMREAIAARHPGSVLKLRMTSTWCDVDAWCAEVAALRCWLNAQSTRSRDRASRVLDALERVGAKPETPVAGDARPGLSAVLQQAAAALTLAARALDEAAA